MEIFYEKYSKDADCAAALGNFDGVHIGHAELLRHTAEKARELGLYSLCCTFLQHPANVLSGKTVTKIITSNDKKTQLIENCGLDGLLFFDFDERFAALSPEDFVAKVLVKKLHAKLVVCGAHYRFGKGQAGDAKLLKDICGLHGIEVIALPLKKSGGEVVSSSRIRLLLEKGDVQAAQVLLGRPFSVSGPIIKGKQLGRELGLPTINIAFDELSVIPKCGVYKSATEIDGRRYACVTNIGTAPTFGGGSQVCETYIIGFEGDLYGRNAEIELLKYIREERKFRSAGELINQIKKDIKIAAE